MAQKLHHWSQELKQGATKLLPMTSPNGVRFLGCITAMRPIATDVE